jgi:glycosyltransferase involved in cell wall biosynthesis
MHNNRRIVVVHYSAPPVVGGVEAVMYAHAEILTREGYPVTIIAGRGDKDALPDGVDFYQVPLLDSQHPAIVDMNQFLEEGIVPDSFQEIIDEIDKHLRVLINNSDNVIIHNIFTKHFNLPLTAGLHRFVDEGIIDNCIAWCHDFSWTSPNSKSKLHPGFPWDLLREYRGDISYVVVSKRRQSELASLFEIAPQEIRVVYNGVDPELLLNISTDGAKLIKRLNLFEYDLILLMPVRVTQAKNIEFAMELVASLIQKGCNAKLILTGPPDPHDVKNMEYFAELKDLRRRLEIEDSFNFVYDVGQIPKEAYIIDMEVVSDLFRVADMLLMPSHREGFGMPILEAGLVGLPIFTTDVPAANEIGGEDVQYIDVSEEPARVAEKVLAWAKEDDIYQMRKKVRKNYIWEAIFRKDMKPLLGE